MAKTGAMGQAAPTIAPARKLLTAARKTATAAVPPEGVAALTALQSEVAASRPPSHYQSFGPAIAIAQGVLLGLGSAAFAGAHALAMIEAIEGFAARQPADGYPPSIVDRFALSYDRILAKIAAADWDGYDQPADLLWKDLGLATQRLMPGGARVIEPEAHLPRSLIWRGGIGQAVRAARLLAGGTGPYLCLHTHAYELEEFNPAGWEATFRRIADLLRLRPALKGVFVGGWLYDPGLPAVTPRLGFHRALTLPHGAATYFYQRDGADSLAFAKSETRRQAFEEGRYTPEQHMLVWPRKPLLAWDAATRA